MNFQYVVRVYLRVVSDKREIAFLSVRQYAESRGDIAVG